MISEIALLIAFFIGFTVGLVSRPKKPKTYVISEFTDINRAAS
jgi:uncharacterized membrane protein YczE